MKYTKWTDPKGIEIPCGYRRITHGKVRLGDLVYNNTNYRDNGGLSDFKVVDDGHIGTKVGIWWLIIRKDKTNRWWCCKGHIVTSKLKPDVCRECRKEEPSLWLSGFIKVKEQE